MAGTARAAQVAALTGRTLCASCNPWLALRPQTRRRRRAICAIGDSPRDIRENFPTGGLLKEREGRASLCGGGPTLPRRSERDFCRTPHALSFTGSR
eukprot:scaffold52153_cov60-Phaeocystis_antarctica.AAC.3